MLFKAQFNELFTFVDLREFFKGRCKKLPLILISIILYFPRRKSHGLWDGALESNEERNRLTAVSLDILAPSSSPRLREELEEWVEEGRRRMAMEDMYGVRNQY